MAGGMPRTGLEHPLLQNVFGDGCPVSCEYLMHTFPPLLSMYLNRCIGVISIIATDGIINFCSYFCSCSSSSSVSVEVV